MHRRMRLQREHLHLRRGWHLQARFRDRSRQRDRKRRQSSDHGRRRHPRRNRDGQCTAVAERRDLRLQLEEHLRSDVWDRLYDNLRCEVHVCGHVSVELHAQLRWHEQLHARNRGEQQRELRGRKRM